MIKNFAYASWSAAYLIFLHGAYHEKSDQIWVELLILAVSMPLVLLSLIMSMPAAVPLRAALVALQLPFAVAFFFRYSMASKWYGMLVLAYLGLSALIGLAIRRKFPEDANRF